MKGLIVYPYRVEQELRKNEDTRRLESVIKIYCKNHKGEDVILEFDWFKPYIYVVKDRELRIDDIPKVITVKNDRKKKLRDNIKSIEVVKRIELETQKEMEFYKVTMWNTTIVQPLSAVLTLKGYDVREFKIPFEQRFLADTQLPVHKWIVIDSKFLKRGGYEGEIKKFKVLEGFKFKEIDENIIKKLNLPEDPLTYMFFDIEVYNRNSMKPGEAPIIAIGFEILSPKTRFKKILIINDDVKNGEVNPEKERKLIKKFITYMKHLNVDVIVGHNIVQFDIPSLYLRSKKLGIKFNIGKNGTEPYVRAKRRVVSGDERKVSMEFSMWDISGRIVFDTLMIAKRDLLGLKYYDLKNILQEIGVREKEERIIIPGQDMWKWYENRYDDIRKSLKFKPEDLKKFEELSKKYTPRQILALYLRDDVNDTVLLFEQLIPLQKAFIEILNRDLQMISYGTSSKLIDAEVINESVKGGFVLPKMITYEVPEDIKQLNDIEVEIEEEDDNEKPRGTYTGAFVQLPVPGIHNGVGVDDFKSLYPTSMITYNLSVETYLYDISKKEFEKKYGVKIDNDFKVIAIVKYFKDKYKLNFVPYYDADIVKKIIEEKRKEEVKTKNVKITDFTPALTKFIVFKDEPQGFLTKITNKFLEKRFATKKLMKETTDEKLKKILDYRQLAYKRLANSVYGYSGYKSSLLYREHIAESITSAGRFAFITTERIAELMGIFALYGDTDSIFLKITPEVRKKIIDEIIKKGRIEYHDIIRDTVNKINNILQVNDIKEIEEIPKKINELLETLESES